MWRGIKPYREEVERLEHVAALHPTPEPVLREDERVRADAPGDDGEDGYLAGRRLCLPQRLVQIIHGGAALARESSGEA